MRPLRIAFSGKVKPSLFEHTLDNKFEQHPLKPEADQLAEREQKLQAAITALGKMVTDLEPKGKHLARLDRMKINIHFKEKERNVVRMKRYNLKQKMLRDILSAADVVSVYFIVSDPWYFLIMCRFAPHASHRRPVH